MVIGGADRQFLLNIYRTLMRSSVDYGCFVYGSAAFTSLLCLDKMQARALMMCDGAFVKPQHWLSLYK